MLLRVALPAAAVSLALPPAAAGAVLLTAQAATIWRWARSQSAPTGSSTRSFNNASTGAKDIAKNGCTWFRHAEKHMRHRSKDGWPRGPSNWQRKGPSRCRPRPALSKRPVRPSPSRRRLRPAPARRPRTRRGCSG
jgi:hypothetical protein